MQKLKGVIFSLRDVVFHKGHNDSKLFAELEKLILWLRERGVLPVFVGNHGWTYKNSDGTSTDVRKVLSGRWGECPWYIASEGDMPFKPQAAAMEAVLSKQGWKHNEAIFVG